ncbi:tetratricopeptide repeat protein [Undibacterium sp. Dicai25W]|uniref:tetratricopeptide repeat protein n=1 Tax=Undibacterium sp. Dicai25W TaxID=3413034 RepID=UPI003BF245CF
MSACVHRSSDAESAPKQSLLTPVEIGQISASAEQAMAAQDYPKSIQLYQSIISANPTVATAWFRLGIAYLRSDQLQQAQHAFEEAIRNDPGMDKTYANLAMTHLLEFRIIAQKALQSDQISDANRSALRSLIADVEHTLNIPAQSQVLVTK